MDQKLLFRVRQYAGERRDKNAPPTVEGAVAYLLDKFREYTRKPQGPFRKSVGRALQQHLEAVAASLQSIGASGGGGNSSGTSGATAQASDSVGRSSSKKRRLEAKSAGEGAGHPGASHSEDLSEDEAQAREAEANMQQPQKLNLLNQTVRAQYKKVSTATPGTPAAATASDVGAAAEANGDEAVSTTRRSAKRLRPATSQPQKEQARTDAIVERPTTRYADLGGISTILQEVRELIEYPLTHPEVYLHLGIEPPRGILLHGPPGCGKTLLANAIAGELGVAFLRISAPEIVSGMSGESEQKVRELFSCAAAAAPSIIFIDEVDAITPKRETSSRGMEKRIVAQLLTSMDSLCLENTGGKPVIVIGATNRPNDLDSALRRAGRFDREICLPVPDLHARRHILEVMCGKMRLSGELDLGLIAYKTPGYVGADLRSLTKEAAVVAINRIFRAIHTVPTQSNPMNVNNVGEPNADSSANRVSPHANFADETALAANREPLTPEQLEPLYVTMEDFVEAVKKVQPSAKREGFATVPDVSWSDVGALCEVREDLALSILQPIAHPERFARLGLSIPAGVLLYGPPGCGKTLLAKAIANESGANFISVKGPELLDKYVGESEKAVRQVFQRARASSPCIVFFDELDSLCPRRGSGGSDSGGGVSERVVNQLLTEMDGLEERRLVFVVAATNRPELIDPAMLRPGRLDKLLYVPLPNAEDRVSILRALSKSAALGDDVDLEQLGHHPKAEGYSGADLSALLREAGLDVLRRLREREVTEGAGVYTDITVIRMENFEAAFRRTQPSVSSRDSRFYLSMKSRLCRARAHSVGEAPEIQDNTA